MKKTLILLIAVLIMQCLIIGCAGKAEKDGYYKLTVTDHFGILTNQLDSEYKAGEIVTVNLMFHSGPSVGIMLNGEQMQPSASVAFEYEMVTFVMPAKDSVLFTTVNGYIYISCPNDKHDFVETLLYTPGSSEQEVVNICKNCGYIESATPQERKLENCLKIGNLSITPIKVEKGSRYSFELCKPYSLYLHIKDVLLTDEPNFYKTVQIICDNEVIEPHFENYSAYANYIFYSFVPKKICADSCVEIKYSLQGVEHSYSFICDVIDYNFEKVNAGAPTYEEIESRQELKQALDSLTYYNLVLPNNAESVENVLWQKNYCSYSFPCDKSTENYQYNTDYLNLLTDSIYYPSALSMVNQNPIADRRVEIYYDDAKFVKNCVNATAIPYFSITYGVIDPCCTNPQYALTNYRFTAISKEYFGNNKTIEKLRYNAINSTFFNLQSHYSSEYFVYTVGDLTISIIRVGTAYYCYFTHSNYYYQIVFEY